MPATVFPITAKHKNLLLHRRWPWHMAFWLGYIVFRFWPYYITVKYFHRVYLEYMLLSEMMFIIVAYFTIWLYKRLFSREKYLPYFLTGVFSWILYLCCRTTFQLYYLRNEPSFRGNTFADIVFSNATFAVVYFLFITACKYGKDAYIVQQSESEKKERQLLAEVNNLKSQIAPHFLFNTLNNLYGLAVDKSDKLPDLMLQLSHLLRHSLYETQKPLVPITGELDTLNSYIKLESVRLEDDLKLKFENTVPPDAPHQVAPLILIVFIENAFKHAKLVESGAVDIYINTTLRNNRFSLTIKNNYNKDKQRSGVGIGLANVKRRLEVLYPGDRHQLTIRHDAHFYTIILELQLVTAGLKVVE